MLANPKNPGTSTTWRGRVIAGSVRPWPENGARPGGAPARWGASPPAAPRTDRPRGIGWRGGPVRDWTVLVTAREGGFARARRLLAGLGQVAETRYYNVLLARVADPRGLPGFLAELAAAHPESVSGLARVAPADRTFTFQTAEEFLARARDAVLALAPSLAGR